MNEQGLVRDRRPIPFRMWTLKRRKLPSLPAPLVLGPSLLILAQLQEGHAQVEMGLGRVGPHCNGALVVLNRLLGLAQAAVKVAQTVVRLGPLGLGLKYV